jgi:hypothetical protein
MRAAVAAVNHHAEGNQDACHGKNHLGFHRLPVAISAIRAPYAIATKGTFIILHREAATELK